MIAFLLRPILSPTRSAPRLPISLLTLACAVMISSAAHAGSFDESVPSPEALAQLEQRASLAGPREQAWLYTELVHSMTEKAGHELSDGDSTAAQATLRQINHYAHLIQTSLERNTHQLKNAEMLMQHTSWRLAQCMHFAGADDKPQVQATLRELNQVNDALLTQVFQH